MATVDDRIKEAEEDIKFLEDNLGEGSIQRDLVLAQLATAKAMLAVAEALNGNLGVFNAHEI